MLAEIAPTSFEINPDLKESGQNLAGIGSNMAEVALA